MGLTVDMTSVTPVIPESEKPKPKSLGHLLFSGSSALGAATLIERGFGFLANIAAARLGGTHIFGAYSIAMTTANNVASYAGAGIGTTANRFSGEYPYGTPRYAGLLRALLFVSLGSALLAVTILWFAAKPLAVNLIRNPGLTGLLRLASFSAGAIILLECFRGLLVGQRRFTALLSLSVLFGTGMLVLLPLASRYGASQMVTVQAAVALSAVVICLLAAGKLQVKPPAITSEVINRHSATGPTATTILRFGVVQLLGMVGLNAAGWWGSSMVARADVSLLQASWFSVALQMRNMCAMPAGLISQTAYAQLTDSGSEGYGGADRVTVISTVAATVVALLVAGPITAVMPWLVAGVYGKGFAGAELAATLAVATGVIHMSSAPAGARLTVVSLRSTGVINGAWGLLVVGLATWLIPNGGASQAAVCFLAGHIFSAVAVLLVLLRQGSASRELVFVTLPALFGSLIFAALSWFRSFQAEKLECSALILLVTFALIWMTIRMGIKISPGMRSFAISKMNSYLAVLRKVLRSWQTKLGL